MLVKSKKAHSHVQDVEETFAVLRKCRLKLNPRKCAFRVSGGRFLGVMVTQRSIEVNLTKIKDILDMGPPPVSTKTTIKAQALANFVFEMTGTTLEEVPEERPWLVHKDRSSTTQGSETGIVITSPQGEDMEFAIKFDLKASNNQAKTRHWY
ncbi:hypothetical protein Sango_0366800 [Sesamum angolense]|uniref:Reverse transcriptase/retrotransposon-derived protein RNase H-like domain-containing protein n=1 Tax=Sesamum angolense TaxID=2727404 RepID=A0AAE1X9S4_9LAMI|nr:hypothetical protein Sango_0366800 [Sesamum angolense]